MVARIDEQVVGFGGLLFQGDDGHVTTLARRRRLPAAARLGTRLMLVLARARHRRGAENLTLEVRSANEAAHRAVPRASGSRRPASARTTTPTSARTR